jgi:hypothetical protein
LVVALLSDVTATAFNAGDKSAIPSARKVGAAAPPDAGPAKTVFALCVASVPVSVPLVVTGDPLTVIIEGNDRATLVTVPPPPVLAMVMVPAPLVTLIPDPAVSVAAATLVPVLPTYS